MAVTTGTATGQYIDQNGDGCELAPGSAGFAAPSPERSAGRKGSCSISGSELAGPCCTVGRSAKLGVLGFAFSWSFPLYDVAFRASVPATVSSCGPAGADSCTSIAGDACLE